MAEDKNAEIGAADDVVIASMGTMTRGSAAMFARRRRILHETRRLMVDGSADGWGMRDLAERSGVSLRTLYNAFGSKEALIAAAVRQYYDKFLRALSDGRDLYDFDWVLGGVVATNLRNQQIREYLSAVVGLYFSPSADLAIRVELRRIAAGFMTPWLELAQARRQLRRGTDISRTIGDIANLQYAINQEWLSGGIADDAFVPVILEAVLTYLAGMTRGAAHERIDALLTDLQGSGTVIAQLMATENARIRSIFEKSGDFWSIDDAFPRLATEKK